MMRLGSQLRAGLVGDEGQSAMMSCSLTFLHFGADCLPFRFRFLSMYACNSVFVIFSGQFTYLNESDFGLNSSNLGSDLQDLGDDRSCRCH